jgi:RNA recognition motif-containing protein
MTNIFVARLDYGVTQEELKSAFEQFGQVNKASLAIDKETGKSKGFAFIEMENDEEAQQAIQALDGFTMHGREIAVKQAENREDNRPKRDFSSAPKKDFSSDRKPFNKQDRFEKPVSNEYKKVDPPVAFVPFTPDLIKPEGRKKDIPAKKSESKPKTHKMEAYKKSGKKPRFDYDDDDDY